METPYSLFRLLEKHIIQLEKHYIHKHITTNSLPKYFDNDVKAFCVLTHASFEGFIEDISLYTMHKCFDTFMSKNIIIRPLLTLFLHYGNISKVKASINNFDKWNTQRSFDLIKDCIITVKDAHSTVIQNNNGFSLDYCSHVLLPVSVDVSSEIRLQNSVVSLKKLRGEYAHKHHSKGSIIRSTSPQDAKLIIEDCLEFCKIIYENANSVCKVK